MPIPIAAVIGAGATLGSAAIGGAATGKLNKQNREFQREQAQLANERNIENWNAQNSYNEGMWMKQREYNEELWSKQNDYDSPQAQMERFKNAGLNPNLIYGGQTNSGSIATADANPAASVVPTQTSNFKYEKSGFAEAAAGVKDGILSYYQHRQQAAQANIAEQNVNLTKAEIALKGGQLANLILSGKQSQFNLDLANDLKETSTDTAKAILSNLRGVAILQNDQHGLNFDKSQQIAQGIKESTARTKNITLDSALKTVQLEMMKNGVNPGDPAWMRISARLLSGFSGGKTIGDLGAWIKEEFDNITSPK